MRIRIPILVLFLMVFLSGCVTQVQKNVVYERKDFSTQQEPEDPMPSEIYLQNMSEIQNRTKNEFLIDKISLDLISFQDKKWNDLYQSDELDCSRMSTYLWDHIRKKFHVAPRIIVSYERQHAWLALKVSDVGNSTEYSHWNMKGTEYYFLEATIPRIVSNDGRKFMINEDIYTSEDFYKADLYIFDSPQDANDFHADKSALGGWNQEFRLKKDDLDRIAHIFE
jgi:hypothetical protein